MQAYIVETGFAPDDTYVNTIPEPEYLGYLIGRNDAGTHVVWVIEPRVAVPTLPIEDILPDDYEEITLDAELSTHGFIRVFLSSLNIDGVVDFIQTQIDNFPE